MNLKVAGSIFSGGGIGDVGVEWGAGIPVVAACELVPSRADLIRRNFPNTRVFQGDLWDLQDEYVRFFRQKFGKRNPWLLTLSPPCQGMSSNGAGRISAEIRAGKRPKEDQRNRLILPGIEVLEQLKPDWFILENVRRMENTVIRNERNSPENILACLFRRLRPLGYSIFANSLDFRNYGVPHHRERLITVGCRIPRLAKRFQGKEAVFSKLPSPFHPAPSHGVDTAVPWVTLRQAIGHLSPLDALAKTQDDEDPYHCVPKWNPEQYFWMKHTPEGETAFHNSSCPVCRKKSLEVDAVLCPCGASLPRPQILKQGVKRLVRGFKSSYRRMQWDKPASTLTMNSGVISSDLKGHPEQNRVLSLREILILSTLDNPLWEKAYSFDGIPYGRMSCDRVFSPRLVREVIGESIPPLAMMRMVRHLLEVEAKFAGQPA